MLTTEPAPVETAREQFVAALDRLETRARQGRRAAVRAQHAVEDGAAALSLRVRRHPLGAVAAGLAVGAVFGAVIAIAAACAVAARADDSQQPAQE